MKIPFSGPSAQQTSLPFNAERTINFYTIADKEGKNQTALYGTPGLELFSTAGTGPGRGSFTAAGSGRYFVVSGAFLFEITSDGTATQRGTLLTGSGPAIIKENGVQLMVSDGTYGYIFTYATNVFAQITDPDFPIAGTVDFIGGYFIVNEVLTGKFYISDLYNGLAWQALNFATAESSPDNLLRVIAVQGQLWLLGSVSSEVWTNTGSSRFPFELISGAVVDMGVLGAYLAEAIDNTLIMVGQNREGSRIVYRMTGFTPQRISTEPIEKLLATITDLSTARTWKYQEQGHVFLVITGGGMETSLCYDLTTQLWHERAFLNIEGDYEPHRGADCSVAFGKIMVIDRRTGQIYRMGLDLYSDNGFALPADRIFTHLSEENQNIHFGNLTVDLEQGVGRTNPFSFIFSPKTEKIFSNPQIQLSLSNDGGRTWLINQLKPMGKIGAFLTRVIFYRLGAARVRTFRIRITDPVKRAIVGLYLNSGQ